jgi:hypothetical protein
LDGFDVFLAPHDEILLESAGIPQYLESLAYFTLPGPASNFITVQPTKDAPECRYPALVIFAPDILGH